MFSTGAGVGILGGGAALDQISYSYKGADCAWAVLFWICGPIIACIVVGFIFTIKNPKLQLTFTKPIDILGTALLSVNF